MTYRAHAHRTQAIGDAEPHPDIRYTLERLIKCGSAPICCYVDSPLPSQRSSLAQSRRASRFCTGAHCSMLSPVFSSRSYLRIQLLVQFPRIPTDQVVESLLQHTHPTGSATGQVLTCLSFPHRSLAALGGARCVLWPRLRPYVSHSCFPHL